ncbi:hypothetical protein M1446_02810 [Candidatus Dependentiae bacterium]|nr:hypothetical protein [Candidatus Dependentiae bacterium]
MFKKLFFLIFLTNLSFSMRIEKLGTISKDELTKLVKAVFVLEEKASEEDNIKMVLEKKDELLKNNDYFKRLMENNLEVFFKAIGQLFKEKYHSYRLTSKLKEYLFKSDIDAMKILIYAGADVNSREKFYGADLLTIRQNVNVNAELKEIQELIFLLDKKFKDKDF